MFCPSALLIKVLSIVLFVYPILINRFLEFLSNTSIRQFLPGFIFLSYCIKAFHFLFVSSSLGYLVIQRKTYRVKYFLKKHRNNLFRKGEKTLWLIAVRQYNCSLNFYLFIYLFIYSFIYLFFTKKECNMVYYQMAVAFFLIQTVLFTLNIGSI